MKQGQGRPTSLSITKEQLANQQDFEEIYIKPKDLFFEHYQVSSDFSNFKKGDLVSGKRQGNGVFYHKDGSRQEGTWNRNLPNGIGVSVYHD